MLEGKLDGKRGRGNQGKYGSRTYATGWIITSWEQEEKRWTGQCILGSSGQQRLIEIR